MWRLLLLLPLRLLWWLLHLTSVLTLALVPLRWWWRLLLLRRLRLRWSLLLLLPSLLSLLPLSLLPLLSLLLLLRRKDPQHILDLRLRYVEALERIDRRAAELLQLLDLPAEVRQRSIALRARSLRLDLRPLFLQIDHVCHDGLEQHQTRLWSRELRGEVGWHTCSGEGLLRRLLLLLGSRFLRRASLLGVLLLLLLLLLWLLLLA